MGAEASTLTMRILFFCDEDLSMPGGGPRQVRELAQALVARGHDVSLVAQESGGRRGGSDLIPKQHGVPGIRLPILRPLSFLIMSAVVLHRACRLSAPDVILWFDSPGQCAPLVIPKARRPPYVLYVNGLPADEIHGAWAVMRMIFARILRLAVQNAAAVVSVCQEILDALVRGAGIPASRGHVIRNGVDPTVFCPRDHRDARQRLGLPDGGRYVGFVGGFFPWHALDTLIAAMPRVLKEHPDVRLLMAGDGQTRRQLEAYADALGLRQAVRFPGRIPFTDVPWWINACDVCVVLHRPVRGYPGDSMKLWEYLACGRPVVATAGPGYGDMIEACDAGRSVHLDDSDDLARTLSSLLKDPEARRRMGEAGRRAVEHAHTWDARAAALEAVLHRAAGGGKLVNTAS
jgi:glycosyltransferase involved in cell wall biosynthesis